MTDKPRYRLRSNSAALTRRQWWFTGIILLVAVIAVLVAGIALGLTFNGDRGLGGLVAGLATLVASLATLITLGILYRARGRDSNRQI